MKEREIRDILKKVCRDLDARAALLPAGAGVVSLVAACGGNVALYDAPGIPMPDEDAGDAKADQQDAVSEDGPSIVYMAPIDAGDEDVGALPPYMAVPPDASDEDAGIMPPYMGAPPDYDE